MAARPILRGIEQFDAEFFGMYAREAELTDPQHRVLLECAWEALEHAGHDPARFNGNIGVFAGSSINTYFLRHVMNDRQKIAEFTSGYQVSQYPQLLGAGQDFTATRIAYKFDLKGPAINLNSACSTSLLAVAQACQSLMLYQSDMALAQLCAENELVKIRLAGQFPNTGDTSASCEQAGKVFTVAMEVRNTPNPNFRRVDAKVVLLEGTASTPLLQLSTVMGRY